MTFYDLLLTKNNSSEEIKKELNMQNTHTYKTKCKIYANENINRQLWQTSPSDQMWYNVHIIVLYFNSFSINNNKKMIINNDMSVLYFLISKLPWQQGKNITTNIVTLFVYINYYRRLM